MTETVVPGSGGSDPAPANPLAGTIAVNGGAMDSSGLGFNLDANGNVVAIGSNVQLWGTVVDAHGKSINDFSDNAQGGVYVYNGENLTLVSDPGQSSNLKVYSGSTTGDGNVNSTDASASKTDLYQLHTQSGYYKDGNNWVDIKKVDGNSGKQEENAPDYMVLIGDSRGATFTPNTNPTLNSPEGNVNRLASISIDGIVSGGNNLEGIINGPLGSEGLELIYTKRNGEQTTDIKTVDSAPTPEPVEDGFSYTAAITASVTGDHDTEWLSDIQVTGIPDGFNVEFESGGDQFTLARDSDGTWTLQWKDDVAQSDKQDVEVTLKISHPEGDSMRGVEVGAQVHAFGDYNGHILESDLATAFDVVAGDDTDADADGDADGDGDADADGDGGGGDDTHDDFDVEVAATLRGPLSQEGVTAVNGGSGHSSGKGFDIDAAGNIVAIGSNVRLWYTHTPNGRDLTQDDIDRIKAASPGVSEDNFSAYAKRTGNGNGPVNNEGMTDVFLVSRDTETTSNKGGYTSPRVAGDPGNGTGYPDFIFLMGDPSDFRDPRQVGETGSGGPNHYNWEIKDSDGKLLLEAMHVADVINGHGDSVHDTDIAFPDREYVIDISAEVIGDSETAALQTITIEGLPAGAVLMGPAGVELVSNGDGSWTLSSVDALQTAEFSLSVKVPADSEQPTSIHVTAQAYDPVSEVTKTTETTAQLQPFDGEEGEAGDLAGEVSLMGLLGAEDDDWVDVEAPHGSDASGGASTGLGADHGVATDAPFFADEDAGLGDILDEFASDDDLSDVLEGALRQHDAGQEADDAEDSVPAGDDGGEGRAGDTASTAPVSDKAGDKDGGKPGAAGAPSGASADHAALDADAMSAQNDMIQQIIEAGKQGGDAI